MSRLLAEHEGYAVLNPLCALLRGDFARIERAVLFHYNAAYLIVGTYQIRTGADIFLQLCYVLVGDINSEFYAGMSLS